MIEIQVCNNAQLRTEHEYVHEGDTVIVKAAGDVKDRQLSFMLAPRFTPRESPDYYSY